MRSTKLKSHKNRPKKLLGVKNLRPLSERLRKKNKTIVFTIGSFDLLNPGHCRYLAEAKALGDILVVGVSTDFSIASIKGEDYPLTTQNIRTELITYLKSVDYVVNVDEKSPYDVLLLLRPDIFLTHAADWEKGLRNGQDKKIVGFYGGKVTTRRSHSPYFGTTALIDHIANIRVIKILEDYIKGRVQSFSLNPAEDLKPADFGPQRPKSKEAFDPKNLIVPPEDLKTFAQSLNRRRKKVVFVSGSYDLLHVGHARFIEQAGLLGDTLVVGIPSDQALTRLKGVGRPIISEYSRAYTLGHLDPVDYVAIFDEDTVLSMLETLKPDIFFTVKEDWNSGYKRSSEYKLLKGYGGKIVRAERQAPLTSSSVIINKLAQKKVQEIFRECMDLEKI